MTMKEALRIVRESEQGSDQYNPEQRAKARGVLLARAEDEYKQWKKEQRAANDG